MAGLHDRLRDYFSGANARTLAKSAPALLLAGSSGAAMAALVGVSGFAETGAGVVIGGIAINVASSLLQTLVRLPPDDDEARETVIEQGLTERDAGVEQAVAAALVAAGPDLALALPSAQREALAARFEQGLRELGGPAETLAPRFAAGLREPGADWKALKDELQHAIAVAGVTQIARVGDEGTIRHFKQGVENPIGSVSQALIGGDKSVFEHTTQIISNPMPQHKPVGPTQRCPDCSTTIPNNSTICPNCGLPMTNFARGSPAEMLLTLSFTPSDDSATFVRWEAPFIGAVVSRFASPYPATALPLLTRALDVLQFLNYPHGHDEPTRRWFTFSVEEQSQLATWKLWDEQGERIHANMHATVGRALYTALTTDAAGHAALSAMRNKAIDGNQPLTLRLRFAPGDVALAALPWELLWPPDEATPLLLSRGQRATCTRHLDLPQALPWTATHRRMMRVLAICPNADIPMTVRDDERAARMAELQPLIDAGQLALREVNPATRRAVVDAVQSFQPDAIHFYGHGRYQDGRGALLLDRGPDPTANNDNHDWTTMEDLAVILGSTRLALIFACQGAMATEGSVLTGVAPALCAANVPLVVAMQLTTRITAATRASGTIYRAIVAGRSLQAAVGEARQVLFAEEADKASWYVPTLYMRTREMGAVYLVPTGAESGRAP